MPGRYRFPTTPEDARRTVIVHALEEAGWRATDGEDWDLHWSHEIAPDSVYDGEGVVNHFRGIGRLTRKDLLADTARRAGLDVMPPSFALPRDHERFRLTAETTPGPWIVKPWSGARGEGIELVARAEDVPLVPGLVVQQYVADPHLLDGFKYSLRWYAAIASVDPLTIHVFDDGFTKLTSRRYRVDEASLGDLFVHLTNPDVQARNPDVKTSSRNLTRSAYAERLRAEGHDPDELFTAIRRAIVAVVLAAREDLIRGLTGTARPFELVAFDVLVDHDLRPLLLECNLGPSITVEAAGRTRAAREERELKERLARDLLALVGVLAPWDGPPLHDVGGFELAWPSAELAELQDVLVLRRPSEGGGAPTVAQGSTAFGVDDHVVLHAPEAAEPLVLNATAAFAWLGTRDGVPPADLAAELTEAVGTPQAEAEEAIWRALGDLADRGALGGGPRAATAAPHRAPRPLVDWNRNLVYRCLGVDVAVHLPSIEVARWVDAAMAPMRSTASEATTLEVERHGAGWRVEGVRVPSLRQVGPAVRGAVLRRAVAGDAVPALRATTLLAGDQTLLVVGDPTTRAALADRCLADGGRCMGDDHVVLLDGGRIEPGRVGLLVRVAPTEWRRPLDDDVLQTPAGELVRVWDRAVATSGSIAPTQIVLADADRHGAVGPVQPIDAIVALLAARPEGFRPLTAAEVGRVVHLAQRLPCVAVSDDVAVPGRLNSGFAVAHAELPVDGPAVGLDRVEGHEEL